MKLRTVAIACLSAGAMYANQDTANRLKESAEVLNEIMATPDKGIPQELLEKSSCIVIVPGLKKAAFILGGKYGKGFLSCRNASGNGWSAPAAIKVEGGSVGFQIGGSETDAIMLVMNKRGAEKLLSSKFTLGGDASVAAGPVGRSSAADTDAKMQAAALSNTAVASTRSLAAIEAASLASSMHANRGYWSTCAHCT